MDTHGTEAKSTIILYLILGEMKKSVNNHQNVNCQWLDFFLGDTLANKVTYCPVTETPLRETQYLTEESRISHLSLKVFAWKLLMIHPRTSVST